MTHVAAAACALRGAPVGTLVVVEPVGGPRFPNGVVLDEGHRGAVQLPLSVGRWWDARCRIDRLDADLVRTFVATLEPLSLPRPPDACVGWGPGLTPAADDVLVGMLIGLRAAGAPGLADALAASCSEADTVPFSRALLDHAARGEAVRPLLDLVYALAGRGDVSRCVISLSRFGATSGRHMIDGVRRAMNVVADR